MTTTPDTVVVPVEPTEAMLANAIGTLIVVDDEASTRTLAAQFYRAMLAARPAATPGEEREAVPVTIYCPVCSDPHLDEGEWAHRPHKTHQCQGCGHEWRPFPFATVGVAHPVRGALNERDVARIIKSELVFCLTSEADASVEIENAEHVASRILAALSRPAPVAGEAVAWLMNDLILKQKSVTRDGVFAQRMADYRYEGKPTYEVTPLYTTPTPQPAPARGGDIDGLEDYLRNQALTAVTDEGASILLEWSDALSAKGGSNREEIDAAADNALYTSERLAALSSAPEGGS